MGPPIESRASGNYKCLKKKFNYLFIRLQVRHRLMAMLWSFTSTRATSPTEAPSRSTPTRWCSSRKSLSSPSPIDWIFWDFSRRSTVRRLATLGWWISRRRFFGSGRTSKLLAVTRRMWRWWAMGQVRPACALTWRPKNGRMRFFTRQLSWAEHRSAPPQSDRLVTTQKRWIEPLTPFPASVDRRHHSWTALGVSGHNFSSRTRPINIGGRLSTKAWATWPPPSYPMTRSC